MSLQNQIRYTRRYLKRFPFTAYPEDILKKLNVPTKDSTSDGSKSTRRRPRDYEQDRIATPYCLSFRIPKSQTKCTETLFRQMDRLNADTTRMRHPSAADKEFLSDLIWSERKTKKLLQDTEDMWDRALQNGQVAEDHHLKYQFKQFKKVPLFQNHPRQILLELRLLKQAFQQRVKGVNSPEVRHGGHNAALVLVTPGLASLVGQNSFEKAILRLWPEEARRWREYHIVTAVVDGTHFPDEDSTTASEGIAVIRGSKAVMFPDLWEEKEPREPEVKDDVGALTFDIGGVSTVTVPLANTLFNNGKMSTLRATRIENSASAQSKDLFERHIRLPPMAKRGATGQARSITNLRLPLEAVTEPRIATESFGNILRRVDINGKSKPASVELEKAITELQERIAKRAEELGIEFPGVWAVVYEKEKGTIPRWHVDTRSPHDEGGGIAMTMIPNLLQLDEHTFAKNPLMGRPFKLLSGGGGWGDKAGLLALDPQISHFAKSEAETKESLFGDAGKSTYIPNGAAVQFFISNERPPPELDQPREYIRRGTSRLADFPVDDGSAFLDRGDVWQKKNKTNEFFPPPKDPYFGTDGVPRVVFGVGSRLPPSKGHDTEMSLHVGEFGAISNKAIYLAEPETRPLQEHPGTQWAPRIKPMKLDMPGAQVQLSSW